MINFDFHKYISKYVKKEDKEVYLEKAKEIKERFIHGDLAYWNELNSFISKKELIKLINITDYIRENCEVFLVIGIGGSYMGSKAIIEALSCPYDKKSPEIIFLGTNLSSEEYYETFKYLRLGILIFLLITLPWHVIMLKTYPDLFFSEYIYKHHILRFLGSDVIHRSQPWYFYLLTLLWGLMPHMFVIIPKLFGRIKFTKLEFVSDFSKFQTLNIIVILLTLIFFSVSKTKLITYILPVYPFAAVIIAKIWNDFIRKDNVKIRYSLVILNSLLITAAFIIPFIASYFLNPDGNLYFMQLVLAILAYFSTVSLIKKKRFNIFLTQMLLVSALFGFTTPLGYKLDYTFGQNDLMKFAEYAKENNYTISTYKTGKRYSLLYYSGLGKINFYSEDNPEWLKQELCRKNNIVIIRNKDIKDLPVKIKEQGKKYSIIEKL